MQRSFPGPAEEGPWQSDAVGPNERSAGCHGSRMFPDEPDPSFSGFPGGSAFPVVIGRWAPSSCGAVSSKAGKDHRCKPSTTANPALSANTLPTRDCGRNRMSRVRPPPGYRLTKHHLQTPNSPSEGLPSCRHRMTAWGVAAPPSSGPPLPGSRPSIRGSSNLVADRCAWRHRSASGGLAGMTAPATIRSRQAPDRHVWCHWPEPGSLVGMMAPATIGSLPVPDRCVRRHWPEPGSLAGMAALAATRSLRWKGERARPMSGDRVRRWPAEQLVLENSGSPHEFSAP